MTLRPATEADLDFVAEIQGRPDYRSMIAEDGRDRLAGYISDPAVEILIFEIDNRRAGFAILKLAASASNRVELLRLALSDPDRGNGQAVLAELKNHVFETLGAHKFWFDVAADNTRARRAYEKAGFTLEGVLRKHWRRRTGDHVDLALYGLLRSEWRSGGSCPHSAPALRLETGEN